MHGHPNTIPTGSFSRRYASCHVTYSSKATKSCCPVTFNIQPRGRHRIKPKKTVGGSSLEEFSELDEHTATTNLGMWYIQIKHPLFITL